MVVEPIGTCIYHRRVALTFYPFTERFDDPRPRLPAYIVVPEAGLIFGIYYERQIERYAVIFQGFYGKVGLLNSLRLVYGLCEEVCADLKPRFFCLNYIVNSVDIETQFGTDTCPSSYSRYYELSLMPPRGSSLYSGPVRRKHRYRACSYCSKRLDLRQYTPTTYTYSYML